MTLESLLWLAFGWLGANLFDSNFIAPYLGQAHASLWLHVLVLIGWIIFWWLGNRQPQSDRRQFYLAVGLIGIFLGSAFFGQLSVRHPQQPIGIHDGAVQTEIAAQKLVHGENPYTANYRDTEYELLNPRIPSGPGINVVWSHYIYPPAIFLLQAPFTLLGLEMRWLLMSALVMVSAIVIWSQREWAMRTRLLLLTAGNPLLWLYVVAGYNDILLVAALAIMAWAWRGQRWLIAGLAFGLALGLKQSAWLALPLFGWWLWQSRADHRMVSRVIKGAAISTAVIFLPFLIWNAPALYDDIIRYASGSIPFSYPISGSTLLQYLRVWGWISSPWSVLPVFWFQLAVGVPMAWLLCRRLGKQIDLSTWLGAVAILMTSVLLVSRYNNNNYLSAVIGLCVLAYAFRRSKAA